MVPQSPYWNDPVHRLIKVKMKASPSASTNGDARDIKTVRLKYLLTIMTQSNEPNEDRRIDRQLRTIARRVNRLEDTQVTWGELNIEFDRLYDEVDELKAEMNQRFTTLETKIEQRFDSLDAKFDLIMRHVTGSSNS
jgi:polyhydroxyalkanoate synthesis regulator phasin